jgi:hypothetical protein
MLMAASVVTLAGGVTWGAFAYGRERGTPLVAWSELQRLSLPGDPVLNLGPPVLPLPIDEVRALTPLAPLAMPRTQDVSQPKLRGPDPSVMAPSDEQARTPAESRNRAARYERWLESQGLVRVEEATVDANNPY